MEVIKKGSVESIIVAMGDRLESISDLSNVTNLRYFVHKKSDNALVQPDSIPAADPDELMWAVCTIDTTLAAYIVDQEYKLYVKYQAGTESPILGPRNFRVVSD